MDLTQIERAIEAWQWWQITSACVTVLGAVMLVARFSRRLWRLTKKPLKALWWAFKFPFWITPCWVIWLGRKVLLGLKPLPDGVSRDSLERARDEGERMRSEGFTVTTRSGGMDHFGDALPYSIPTFANEIPTYKWKPLPETGRKRVGSSVQEFSAFTSAFQRGVEYANEEKRKATQKLWVHFPEARPDSPAEKARKEALTLLQELNKDEPPLRKSRTFLEGEWANEPCDHHCNWTDKGGEFWTCTLCGDSVGVPVNEPKLEKEPSWETDKYHAPCGHHVGSPEKMAEPAVTGYGTDGVAVMLHHYCGVCGAVHEWDIHKKRWRV